MLYAVLATIVSVNLAYAFSLLALWVHLRRYPRCICPRCGAEHIQEEGSDD